MDHAELHDGAGGASVHGSQQVVAHATVVLEGIDSFEVDDVEEVESVNVSFSG